MSGVAAAGESNGHFDSGSKAATHEGEIKMARDGSEEITHDAPIHLCHQGQIRFALPVSVREYPNLVVSPHLLGENIVQSR